MVTETEKQVVQEMEDLSEGKQDGCTGEENSSTDTQKTQSMKTRRGVNILHLFLVNYCFLIVFYMSQNIYHVGVIRTIERRFGLSSAQSGVILAINDIAHILVVVLVGYFGKRAHKPRVMSASMFLMALSALMMASPYMIFKHEPLRDEVKTSSPYYSAQPLQNKTHEEFGTNSLCNEGESNVCSSEEIQRASANKIAYGILLTAQFLAGLGGSSITTYGYAYIDENSEKYKSALYLGIVSAAFSISPTAGLGLSSICLRLPEVPGSEGSPSDPTWIGCWWLGYIISACCITITCIPMWFFPKSMIKPETQEKPKRTRKEKTHIIEELKEFPKAMLSLGKNAPYMVQLIKSVLSMYVVSGLCANIPRYLEIHFRQPAHKASVVAISGAFGGLIGGFVGGYIMKKRKMGPLGATRIMIFSSVSYAIGIIVIMNLACPQLEVAGLWNNKGQISIDVPCNQNCTCSAERAAYNPVCGEDGLTYFSPCHAGCNELVNGTYKDCRCIPSAPTGSTSHNSINGSALPGLCLKGCHLLLPYIFVLFLCTLLSSASKSPTTILVFRIVSNDERAFALGLTSFAQNLLGFIPAPVIIGALIDSTCILWQKTCSESGTGNCLWFNSNMFRLLTHGFGLLFEVLVLVCIIIIYFLVKKMKFPDDNIQNGKTVHQVNETKG